MDFLLNRFSQVNCLSKLDQRSDSQSSCPTWNGCGWTFKRSSPVKMWRIACVPSSSIGPIPSSFHHSSVLLLKLYCMFLQDAHRLLRLIHGRTQHHTPSNIYFRTPCGKHIKGPVGSTRPVSSISSHQNSISLQQIIFHLSF